MLNKRILVLIFVVAFLTLLVGCLPGITPSPPEGVIGGRIMAPPGPETTKDITGWIPLANATVTITDSEGVTHTVTTDENGYYTFTDIAVDANTIITAAGTVDGNTVIVKDVIPQAVAADEDYEAGIADAESTALALIIEELLEQGLDPGDINLEEIQASEDFTEVVEQVDSILEENGNVTTDPGLTNTVGNVAEDIINPPEPTPTPQPTPVFLTSIVVKPKTMTLFVGEPEDIVSVTAHYSNGSTANITLGSCTYASSAPGVATVSVVGLVTAVAEGTATITVTYKGKTDTIAVTVTHLPMEIMIVDPLTFTIDVPTEFTVEVVANSDVNKNVRFYFTLPTLPPYDYTIELFYNNDWMVLNAVEYPFYNPSTGEIVLGELDGDPLIDEELTFRGTFDVEGTYSTTVEVWTVIPAVTPEDPAEKDVLLYSKVINFEVNDLVHNTDTDKYYHTIQAAIDDASTLAGHTIEVAPGTYTLTSPISVDKTLTLTGVIGDPGSVIINAPTSGDDKDCFQVKADDVTIQGFRIQGAYTSVSGPGGQNAGIMVGNDGGGGNTSLMAETTAYLGLTVTITNNEITDCDYGIYLYGIHDSIVTYNTITDGHEGLMGWHGDAIQIYFATGYPITNNDISYNTMDNVRNGMMFNSEDHEITLDFSGNNVEGNTMTDVWNTGIIFQAGSGTSGSPITIRNNNIDTSTGAKGNDEQNENGLITVYTDYTEITGNTLTNSCHHGLWIDGSNHTVTGNTITSNSKNGINVGHYKPDAYIYGAAFADLIREDITILDNTINEWNKGGIVVKDVLSVQIEGNIISTTDHSVAPNGIQVGYIMDLTATTGTVNNNQISGCHWDGYDPLTETYEDDWTGSGILVIAPNSALEISGNEVQSCDVGLDIEAGTGTPITNNDVYDNSYGFVLWNTDPTINDNNIYQNDLAGVYRALDGILTGTLDATDNWWGHATGPVHSTNVAGEGDVVSDDVDFYPWSIELN